MGCRHALTSTTSLGAHRSPPGAGARAGFSLIELLATMLTIGILVAITVPPARETTGSARAAALAGRVRAVQLAYAAAELPHADDVRAEAGTVPAVFVRSLGSAHFRGEGGGRRTHPTPSRNSRNHGFHVFRGSKPTLKPVAGKAIF